MADSKRTIAQLFAALKEAFASLDPELRPNFNPPASLSEIESAERKLGVTFPVELKELLLCANGQDFPNSDAHPIFPIHRFAPGEWGTTSFTWLCSVESIVKLTGYARDEYEELKNDGPFELFGPTAYHGRLLALSATANSDSLAIDLQPAKGGRLGQVVMVRTQPFQVAVLAPSLREFLELLLVGYSSGRYSFDDSGFWVEP